MKRGVLLKNRPSGVEIIAGSNVQQKGDVVPEYVINYNSFLSRFSEITDNSGLMAIKLLKSLGVKRIKIAGMDGFKENQSENYYDAQMLFEKVNESYKKNHYMTMELKEIIRDTEIVFITPTLYSV